MPSSFNNTGKDPNQKAGDKKLNRSAVLTILSLAVAVVIIITAAIIANRDKEPTKLPDATSTEKPTDMPQTEEPTDATETGKPTEKPTGSTQVGNQLPSFILPVSGVLSSKHDPDLQVFSPTMNDYRVHLGVDLVTKENAPVYSAADGKVSKIWVDPLMGYCMAVSHSGDCVTVYKNLADTLPEGIAEGVSVRSGQLIATVGNSAMIEVGSEPHLHFEMTVGDLAVDPLEYFDEAALESIKTDSTHE